MYSWIESHNFKKNSPNIFKLLTVSEVVWGKKCNNASDVWVEESKGSYLPASCVCRGGSEESLRSKFHGCLLQPVTSHWSISFSVLLCLSLSLELHWLVQFILLPCFLTVHLVLAILFSLQFQVHVWRQDAANLLYVCCCQSHWPSHASVSLFQQRKN